MDQTMAAGAQIEVLKEKWGDSGCVAQKKCIWCGMVRASSEFARNTYCDGGLQACGSNPATSDKRQPRDSTSAR